MGDNLHRSFGLIIGQVLPGLLIMFGLSFRVPAIREWLGVAARQDVTLAGVAFVLLGAVFCGLVLSGARYVLFERLVGVGAGEDGALRARRDPGVEAAYQNTLTQHYAYYQFYGSTAVAWPIFVGLFLSVVPAYWAATVAGAVMVEILLVLSATDAMRRFLRKRALVLDVAPVERHA